MFSDVYKSTKFPSERCMICVGQGYTLIVTFVFHQFLLKLILLYDDMANKGLSAEAKNRQL